MSEQEDLAKLYPGEVGIVFNPIDWKRFLGYLYLAIFGFWAVFFVEPQGPGTRLLIAAGGAAIALVVVRLVVYFYPAFGHYPTGLE